MGTMWHTKLRPIYTASTSKKQHRDVAMVTYNGKVVEGRPRSHSAPETAVMGTGLLGGMDLVHNCPPPPPPPPPPPLDKGDVLADSTCLLAGGGGSPHPALRSMHNGMTTTVPQNLTSPDLNGCHPTPQNFPCPQHRGGVGGGGTGGRVAHSGGSGGGGGSCGGRGPRIRQFSVQSRRENLEMKCCRINVLLVIMQLALGAVVTALAFYMQTLSPSIQIRECPYWAGIPLLLAGVVGIYFCATDFAAYAGTVKAFVVKCICFTLSGACVFLCMIGSVFPGIHGNRISSYVGDCTLIKNAHCLCMLSEAPNARVYEYKNVGTCDLVKTSVKDYLILQCALNAIASGVCFWFVTLLWKSRYQDFYSGLRFYSYNASPPPPHG